MDVSKETKIAILKAELQILDNTIYQFTIKARVAKDINDEPVMKNSADQLAVFHKYKDKYEELLKAEETVQENI